MVAFPLDVLNGNMHCRSCDRVLIPYDYFLKGEDFQDIDVCKDCFIIILKDILEEEKEKERRQQRQQRLIAASKRVRRT